MPTVRARSCAIGSSCSSPRKTPAGAGSYALVAASTTSATVAAGVDDDQDDCDCDRDHEDCQRHPTAAMARLLAIRGQGITSVLGTYTRREAKPNQVSTVRT